MRGAYGYEMHGASGKGKTCKAHVGTVCEAHMGMRCKVHQVKVRHMKHIQKDRGCKVHKGDEEGKKNGGLEGMCWCVVCNIRKEGPEGVW